MKKTAPIESKTLNMAYWAKSNPHKTRWIIVIAHFGMGAITIFAGSLLAGIGIKASPPWTIVPAMLGLATLLLYPTFKGKGDWGKRKLKDAIVLAATLVFYLSLGIQVEAIQNPIVVLQQNQLFSNPVFASQAPEAQGDRSPMASPQHLRYHEATPQLAMPQSPDHAAMHIFSQDPPGATTATASAQSVAPSLTEISKVAPHQNPMHPKSRGGRVTLFVFAIFIGIGLAFLIYALGCTAFCAGIPILGAAIWIVGWGGLIVALIFIGRALFR